MMNAEQPTLGGGAAKRSLTSEKLNKTSPKTSVNLRTLCEPL